MYNIFITMRSFRLFSSFCSDFSSLQKRFFKVASQIEAEYLPKKIKTGHCYRTLYPWASVAELSKHLASSVVYNKDGLIALNKPFGIKIHGHDKPGTRSKGGQRYVTSTVPECELTIEDTLESLKDHLNVSSLTILKSAERYTSGIVLLSTNEKTSAAVKKSFNVAKHQKRPHLTHWIITLGYPVMQFREEKVGIHFLEVENKEMKQPVIVTNVSKRSCKMKKVYPVQVAYRMLSVNPTLATSLVEISTSSVKWHFVRVYASNRIASVLGDIMYSNRMNTLLGMPVKLHIEHALAFDVQPLPEKMAEALNLPKGVNGHLMMPTMSHLRSILLPSFKGEDVTITAEAPYHFQWTTEQLKLLSSCI